MKRELATEQKMKRIGLFDKDLRAARRLFSEEFYISLYEDVAKQSTQTPFEHYMNHGWREGRDPSPTFSAFYYTVSHLDGRTHENPLLHYVKFGQKRKLVCKPSSVAEFQLLQIAFIECEFDEFYYRNNYEDCTKDAVSHYFFSNWDGGVRNPNRDFKTQAYLNSHQALKKMDVDLFAHYLLYTGNRKQNRQTVSHNFISHASNTTPDIPNYQLIEPFFDKEFYLNMNEDVRKANVDPIVHYLQNGWQESRNPTPTFWSSYYLYRNFDVVLSKQNPFVHYIKYGKSENRPCNPIGNDAWNDMRDIGSLDWSKLVHRDRSNADVLVIMPVYKGRYETLNAINALLRSTSTVGFHLIVIIDATPDLELKIELENLANLGYFTALSNIENLGFVGSTNKGLKLVTVEDVVLLNSDAVVFGNWLDRLHHHARSKDNIATVTPFSNNATIFSYPDPTQNNLIALEIDGSVLDETCAIANAGSSIEVPTGVGFCMYITNTALRSVGLLDEEIFGKGYGEENDFCMRARQIGLRNLHALDVFVFHKGQVSFGAFSSERNDIALEAVVSKHPGYILAVDRYVRSNPARNARKRIDVLRLARYVDKKTVVLLFVGSSGGTKLHIDELAKRLLEDGYNVLSMEFNPAVSTQVALRFEVEEKVYTYDPINFNIHDSMADLFFSSISPALIHIHSLGSMLAPDIERLNELTAMVHSKIYFTVHDFNAICLRSNFVRDDGQYCANQDKTPCNECYWFGKSRPSQVELDRRYAAFDQLFRGAICIAPSKSAKSRICSAFPESKVIVRPHWPQVINSQHQFERPTRDFKRIAIVGAIGPHKGSDLIYAVSKSCIARSLPIEFKLVGHSDMDETMRSVRVFPTGEYKSEDEALRLLKELEPDAIWLPSICPETYGYTLNIALAAQIPAIAFDMGALGERMNDIDWGFVLDSNLMHDPNRLADILLSLPFEQAWSKRSPYKFQTYDNLLKDYYGVNGGAI